jgi:hypothetical protein
MHSDRCTPNQHARAAHLALAPVGQLNVCRDHALGLLAVLLAVHAISVKHRHLHLQGGGMRREGEGEGGKREEGREGGRSVKGVGEIGRERG